MTAVVAIMKIFDQNIVNSRKASSGKLSIKPNKWPNLKKKHLDSAKSHQTGLMEPVNDVNEGLIVKKKTVGHYLTLVQVATSFSSENGPRNTCQV